MRWRKIGIIMGGGALPIRLAEACASRDRPFVPIRLVGFADEAAQALGGYDLHLGEAGKLVRILKETECDAVTLAGVVPRPDFSQLKLDWRAAAVLPRLVAAAAGGDGAILSVIVDAFEAEGYKVIGADEVAADLAAGAGVLGAHAPSEADMEDIRKAARLISAIGPFDVGQAAVVSGGLVLAVEAAEGTDGMLARCAMLPEPVRGGQGPRGVLLKRPKPGQELRVDLPTVGVKTIEGAAAAGLAGVAVEAGRSLLMDAPAAIAAADDAGLFIFGFRASDFD
ncbi:MAG: UDP-2,3-diacylglucosamine diphosphatase LpxI [Pseudomonadota bacterium]